MALFSRTTIKMFVLVERSTVNVALLSTFQAVQYLWRNDIGFCWIISYCSSSVTPFLLVWYKAIGICSGIIWESERHLKPLKPPFSLSRSMWYLFHKVLFAEFGFHLRKITGTEWARQYNIYKFWFGPYQISHILFG